MQKHTRLIAGLAAAGAAAVVWFPASAGASTCTTECGGDVPGQPGLTQAATSIATSDGAGTAGAAVAESAIGFRLAGNHNETVLSLA